jgi:hypothetical protein
MLRGSVFELDGMTLSYFEPSLRHNELLRQLKLADHKKNKCADRGGASSLSLSLSLSLSKLAGCFPLSLLLTLLLCCALPAVWPCCAVLCCAVLCCVSAGGGRG